MRPKHNQLIYSITIKKNLPIGTSTRSARGQNNCLAIFVYLTRFQNHKMGVQAMFKKITHGNIKKRKANI